jgi:hypothetical protein
MAIREWSGKMGDAMKQLRLLQMATGLPEDVREAGFPRRLSLACLL